MDLFSAMDILLKLTQEYADWSENSVNSREAVSC